MYILQVKKDHKIFSHKNHEVKQTEDNVSLMLTNFQSKRWLQLNTKKSQWRLDNLPSHRKKNFFWGFLCINGPVWSYMNFFSIFKSFLNFQEKLALFKFGQLPHLSTNFVPKFYFTPLISRFSPSSQYLLISLFPDYPFVKFSQITYIFHAFLIFPIFHLNPRVPIFPI